MIAPKVSGTSGLGLSTAAAFAYCGSLGESSRVANLEEVAALSINSRFLSIESSGVYGTSTPRQRDEEGSYLFAVDWGIGNALYASVDKSGESGPQFICVER